MYIFKFKSHQVNVLCVGPPDNMSCCVLSAALAGDNTHVPLEGSGGELSGCRGSFTQASILNGSRGSGGLECLNTADRRGLQAGSVSTAFCRAEEE